VACADAVRARTRPESGAPPGGRVARAQARL